MSESSREKITFMGWKMVLGSVWFFICCVFFVVIAVVLEKKGA